MDIGNAELACRALGIGPIGAPANQTGRCAMSGAEIAKGDLVIDASYGANFMDDLDLAARGSRVISGYVAPLLRKGVMARTQRALFSEEGAFSLTKDDYRAWFLLEPPAPPFVAVIGDSTLQHLIWRTPVTWSTELLMVRLGGRLLRIRRSLVVEVAGWVAGFEVPVFVRLDREVKDLRHARISSRALPLLSLKQQAQLARLSLGETWALSVLAKKTAAVPMRPPLIELPAATEEADHA